MKTEDILNSIKTAFPQAAGSDEAGVALVFTAKEDLKPLLRFLKEKLGFGYLMFNSAIDRMADNKLEAVYLLCTNDNTTQIKVKTSLDRSNAEIETVSDIFRTAEWHERETAELFGIRFTGHPDPRRLLLTDELEGFPLRKDFKNDHLIPLPSGKKEE